MNKDYFSLSISKVAAVVFLCTSVYFGIDAYKARHPKPTPPPCPVSYNYSDGDAVGVINYETAQALSENYNKSKSPINGITEDGQRVLQEDSRSVWFSLERLKNFIWHIEDRNCKNPCKRTLGLRIYFGRYPDLTVTNNSYLGLEGLPKEYSNRHTLFMVPTYEDKDGNNRDFYPLDTDCKTPTLASAPTEYYGPADLNLIRHKITPFIFLFDMAPAPGGSQNHGGLIPPGSAAGTSF